MMLTEAVREHEGGKKVPDFRAVGLIGGAGVGSEAGVRGGIGAGEGCGGEALLAGVADAPDGRADDEQEANFDENFAAVEIVHSAAGQIGISENAVSEEADGCGVGEVMEELPEMASELDAVERSDDDNDEEIESGGANGVFEGLKRRPYGKGNVGEAEGGAVVEEQRKRMERGESEGGIAGPAMNAKNVEAAVRPVAHGAVASENHQADEDVGSGESHGDEADVCRY